MSKSPSKFLIEELLSQQCPRTDQESSSNMLHTLIAKTIANLAQILKKKLRDFFLLFLTDNLSVRLIQTDAVATRVEE